MCCAIGAVSLRLPDHLEGQLHEEARRRGQPRSQLLREALESLLHQWLQRLQGPVLGPADLAQPLPLLKAQVGAVLDQAAGQIVRERQATPPANPWRLLSELLRNGLACQALALGFAALAVRPGAEVSLLREWQRGWAQWQWRLKRLASRRGGTCDAEYIRQLSGEERDP